MTQQPKGRGTVVTYSCRASRHHESVTLRELASRLAAIKDCDFGDEYDPVRRYSGPLYFVPNDTLVGIEAAQGLGINGEHDLFGGVVPFAFAATKTITHPLPDAESVSPKGWSAAFAERVRDLVLPGYSTFARRDARIAGMRLLELGRVRLKLPARLGGLGQSGGDDERALDDQLESLDNDNLSRDGPVLEQDLAEVLTRSVGQICVDDMRASYCGVQRLTANHHGEQVYGGSDLTIVRGGFDQLLKLALAPEVETAIGQARGYHTAAMTSFRGMFASRCDYDIAQGVDSGGHRRYGTAGELDDRDGPGREGGRQGHVGRYAAARSPGIDVGVRTTAASGCTSSGAARVLGSLRRHESRSREVQARSSVHNRRQPS